MFIFGLIYLVIIWSCIFIRPRQHQRHPRKQWPRVVNANHFARQWADISI